MSDVELDPKLAMLHKELIQVFHESRYTDGIIADVLNGMQSPYPNPKDYTAEIVGKMREGWDGK